MAIRDLTRSRKTYSFFRSPPVADMGSTVKPTIAGSYSANVLDYGAKGTGTVNDLAAFQLAAASGFKTVFVPQGTYLLGTGSISVANGQTWYLLGSTLIQSGTNAITFNCSTIDDWALIGPCVITGSGNASGTSAAVYVAGCNRFRVEDITAKSISGWGFKQDPGSPSGTSRGDQGQYTNIQALSCYYGFENTVGTGAEYCTLIAPMISLCTYGMVVAAGNTTVCGGNVVDNTNGIFLGGGSNNCHGIFAAVNINHNTNYGLKVDSAVSNGHTFAGCHFYDSQIWISGSKGISIVDGTIDSTIKCDGGTNIGYNIINNNYIESTTVVTGSASRYLLLSDNYKSTGPWSLNDKAACYVKASRTGSTQSVSAGNTTLIFNTETDDNRSAYDATTGIFTAPWDGEYELNAWIAITGTALSTSYITFLKNSTTIGYFPVLLNTTLLIGEGTFKVNLAAGDTMKIQSTITGTSPVLAISTSFIVIRSLD